MIKVGSSTCIKGFEYNDGNLKVKYNNGVNYIYENVPAKLYHDLKSCDSTGRNVVTQIKGKFKCYKELV